MTTTLLLPPSTLKHQNSTSSSGSTDSRTSMDTALSNDDPYLGSENKESCRSTSSLKQNIYETNKYMSQVKKILREDVFQFMKKPTIELFRISRLMRNKDVQKDPNQIQQLKKLKYRCKLARDHLSSIFHSDFLEPREYVKLNDFNKDQLEILVTCRKIRQADAVLKECYQFKEPEKYAMDDCETVENP